MIESWPDHLKHVSSAHLARAQQTVIDPNKGRPNGPKRGQLLQISNKLTLRTKVTENRKQLKY